MTEEGQIFWDYLSVIAGQAFFSFFSLVTTILIAQTLQPEGYGIFTLFLMATGICLTLFMNWPNAAIICYGKEEFIKEGLIRETFWARLLIFALSFIGITIVLFLIKDWLVTYIGISAQDFPLILLYIAFFSLGEIFSNIFRAIGMVKLYGFNLFLKAGCQFVLLISFFFVFKGFTVTEIIILMIVSQVIVFLLPIMVLKINWIYPPKIEFQKIGKMISYSWPFIVSAASVILIGYVGTILIKYYLSSYDVGVYAVAYNNSILVFGIMLALNPVLFPLFMIFKVQNRYDLIRTYIDKTTPIGIFLWSILISIVIIFSSLLIPFLFGNPYQNATLPFMILLAGVSFQSISGFYSSIYSAFEQTKSLVFISVLISLVNIAGMFLLIPVFGILGAAVATSIAYSVGNIVYLPMMNFLAKNKNNSIKIDSKRYFDVLYNLPTLVVLGLCIFFSEWWQQVIVGFFIIALSFIYAKKSGLFCKESIELISFIEMPGVLKKNIIKTFQWLS